MLTLMLTRCIAITVTHKLLRVKEEFLTTVGNPTPIL